MARTNIELDNRLVDEGLKRTGLSTKRELVQAALESFVKKQRLKDLLKFKGKVSWQGNLRRMRRGRAWSS